MTAEIVLLAGPTASGKSALALQWAERCGGSVINGDSMQVYADLRILSARPSAAEEARAEHRLYGHVDAAEAYSVGRWLHDVAPLLRSGKPLVIVGGTGLYFDALLHGLSIMPPIPPDIRSAWRRRGDEEPPEALHAILQARDPEMAAELRPSDPQRILRALEVLDATGRSLADWQRQPVEPLLSLAATRCFVLAPDRAWLRQRIGDRFAQMMEQGALAEAEHLAARRLDPALPAMRALGVAPLLDHLAGTISLADAVERAVTQTRQFAKRQETWFRNRFADWTRLDPEVGALPDSRH